MPLIQSDRSILSSLISLERINWYLSSFCKEFVIKGRSHLRQPLSIGCGQLCYESNQIAGFFYQQFLWKVLAYFLDFLYGNICQMKVSDYLCYLSTCVGRVCPVMLLIPRLQHQCQCQFPTLSQRCSLTLSSCCYNVATTLSIGFLGHFTTDYSDFFLFIETWESYKSAKWHLWRPTRGGRPRKFGQFCKWLQIIFWEGESLFSALCKVFYHILRC